jgi:hypothetical protein
MADSAAQASEMQLDLEPDFDFGGVSDQLAKDAEELKFWRAMREHQLLVSRAEILHQASEKLLQRAEKLEETINKGIHIYDIQVGDTL